ncbi:hypothetical protein FRC04_006667 [Tulasnella sp. 424]|nr:hypothetical protein FRC04_006667 [Tulasnella sp. 424]
MADPACIPPSLQIPSETDLLIRSLTTALALFSPNSAAKNKNKHHQSSRYDQFDRMSLFFVSGAAGDAAAITALTEGNCVTFQAVQAQTDSDGRFAVPKNPEHSFDGNQNEDSEASGKLSPDAPNEPARHCLQWSSYQEEQGDHIKAARLLHRYIYSFCIDKIFRRFNSKIPGFTPRYISLLLPPTDNITFEDYQAHSGKDIVLPQRLATRDESVLHKFLEARYPGRSFKLSDSPTKQLILDVEGQWTLWTFFKDYLKQAQDCLNDVRDTKSKQGDLKEEEIQTALQRLNELRLGLGVIFQLARRSPNFWIVMGRMAPLLEARLVGICLADGSVLRAYFVQQGPETHGNHPPSVGPTPHPGPGRDSAEHSPSSATDTGSDYHPSSPHSVA